MFEPFARINNRLESAKTDSDFSYFYELMLYGEFLTKIVNLFLISCINEDNERSRYRQEYNIARANSIGDFAHSIDEILTGPSAQLLTTAIRDKELNELTKKCSSGEWQYDTQKDLYDVIELFNLPHEKLQTKSSFKNWFNMFTYLRNKTKGHGATKTEVCSKCCPILENSILNIVYNFSAFNRTWVHLHRNYSGKYRLSYLNKNKTDDIDSLKRENNQMYSNGIYCVVDKLRAINFFYTDSELTDFFIVNGNLKNEKFECISYISDVRQDRSSKDFLVPVTELPSSHTEGYKHLDVIGKCFTNLPTAIEEYIDRRELEIELEKVILEEDRFPIITLLGRGGIGKTTLALNVLKKIANKGRFDLIVWFSSRDIDLMLEGPKQVKTKVLNQNDISNYYCDLLEVNIKDKLSYFSNQLTVNEIGRTLFVFDNFETVSDPLEVYEWLNTYIRNPNKILITSRISRNFKADYPIEVGGMNEEECRKMIELYRQKLKIDSILDAYYVDELIQESNGHPYIIKILLGEVAKTGKLGKIERIVAEQDRILDALFNRTYNLLTPVAKRVFLTLCSWNSLVPAIALEAVLLRPENERANIEKALEELSKSSFIELINEGNDTMINVPLAAAIFGKSELEISPDKLKILEDKKLLMEFGSTKYKSISVGVAEKIERKFKSIASRIKSLDDFKKELPVLLYLASRYTDTYRYISDVYLEFQDYESVKYYIRENIKVEIDNIKKIQLWKKLAYINQITSDVEGEITAIFELVIIPDIDFADLSNFANRVNQINFNSDIIKNSEYKNMLFEKLITLMSERIIEGNSTDYSRLAWLLINSGYEDSAIEYAKKGLDIDPDNPYCQKLVIKLTKNGYYS